ncbi:MAG: peptidylprolyl isomerase [Oscillospiraceae bacterium]|nr:peptidylprolyl isomerase [Oscillospiraceae bacterium]
MKKLVMILLVLCLAAVAVIGTLDARTGLPVPAAASVEPAAETDGTASAGQNNYVIAGSEYQSPETDAAAPEQETQEEAQQEAQQEDGSAAGTETAAEEGPVSGRLDYQAMYALHDKEDKVLKIGDEEESWGDYFYVLYSQCSQIENYFDSMAAYYGMRFSWTDPIEEGTEETFAETASETAETLMVQLAALEKFAADHDISLGEEELAAVEEQKKQDRLSALGEDATDEEFSAVRQQVYLSDEMYDRIVRQNILYQTCFNRLYGEKAEKLSDEEALQYLKDNGYLSAAHILFQNTDPETGEKLDDEALAAKRAELEALVAELRAIEDDEERAKAFLEKVSELSEDPGSAYYPEGYTFTEGRMVPEFENAAKALEDYAVSDIVETSYGYHVLLRMPLKADAIIEFSSTTNEARTARMLAANALYGKQLQETADALTLNWLDGVEAPKLPDYVNP